MGRNQSVSTAAQPEACFRGIDRTHSLREAESNNFLSKGSRGEIVLCVESCFDTCFK